MSGSSLDGLDMALCRFDETGAATDYQIEAAITIAFDRDWSDKLREAPFMSGKELMQLDADFGAWIGHQALQWLKSPERTADLIASHGHTVFHQPDHHFTTQIGSGAHIAAVAGMDTITSFRNTDVALGGQGAPFAPVVDRGLLAGYQGYLNLGGIANVTVLTQDDIWKAWDIAPCNQVLNYLAQQSFEPFDRDGHIAAAGKVHPEMLAELTAMFPFRGSSAFSISNETVWSTWIRYLDGKESDNKDLLATATEAIAHVLLEHLAPVITRPAKVLVTGGGAHNAFLIEQIRRKGETACISFHLPDQQIIDYKESLLMAYLGYLYLKDRSYGISGMTGARRDSLGGAYFKAPK